MESDTLGQYQQFVSSLAVTCPRWDGIVAAWIHGSRATGNHHDKSDLDVLFLVEDARHLITTHTQLLSICRYDEDFPDYFGTTPVPYWEIDQGEVGVRIMPLTELSERIDRLSQTLNGFEAEQAFAQHAIISASPIFDPDNHLLSAQSKCHKVPSRIYLQVTCKYLRLLGQKMQWWDVRPRWKNEFERLSDMGVILEEIARCHYALNNKFFMPGMKDYDRDLQSLRPNLSSDLYDLLNLSPTVPQQHTRAVVRRVYAKLDEFARSSRWDKNEQ